MSFCALCVLLLANEVLDFVFGSQVVSSETSTMETQALSSKSKVSARKEIFACVAHEKARPGVEETRKHLMA